jgi:hypothetical protein
MCRASTTVPALSEEPEEPVAESVAEALSPVVVAVAPPVELSKMVSDVAVAELSSPPYSEVIEATAELRRGSALTTDETYDSTKLRSEGAAVYNNVSRIFGKGTGTKKPTAKTLVMESIWTE